MSTDQITDLGTWMLSWRRNRCAAFGCARKLFAGAGVFRQTDALEVVENPRRLGGGMGCARFFCCSELELAPAHEFFCERARHSFLNYRSAVA